MRENGGVAARLWPAIWADRLDNELGLTCFPRMTGAVKGLGKARIANRRYDLVSQTRVRWKSKERMEILCAY